MQRVFKEDICMFRDSDVFFLQSWKETAGDDEEEEEQCVATQHDKNS